MIKQRIKKISIIVIKYSLYSITYLSISTAIASNLKPNNLPFELNELLTPPNISNMKIRWSNIHNPPNPNILYSLPSTHLIN